MKVLGVDPSLTATGLAVVTDAEPGTFGPFGLAVRTGRVNTLGARGHQRLDLITSEVRSKARDADLVVIEGLAYNARDTDRAGAGLWWILTHNLWRLRVPVAIVPPTNRAKYATGKGNAPKDAVLLACERRYGGAGGVAIVDNNEADALVLAAMGARALERPVEDSLPQLNLAAMAGVTWPELMGV